MPSRTTLNLLDRLYAAAAGEIALDAALAATADYAGAALGLLVLGAETGIRVLAATGLDALPAADTLAGLDAMLAQNPAGPHDAGPVELDAAALPAGLAAAGARDMADALDCRHLLLLPLAAGVPERAVLLLARRHADGAFSPARRERGNTLRPHWRRVLQWRGCLSGSGVRAGQLAAALDALPYPLLLVDDGRRLLQANVAARTRLRAADALTELRGRLVACGAEREAFEADWAAMCADAAGTGRAFGLRRHGDTGSLGLEATALDGAGERVWLLRVAETTASRARLAAGWRLQFNLTASECRVGLALLEHGDAISAAAALRIAGNTVRSHLKTMFTKTGAHSQAALALRLAQPLRLVD